MPLPAIIKRFLARRRSSTPVESYELPLLSENDDGDEPALKAEASSSAVHRRTRGSRRRCRGRSEASHPGGAESSYSAIAVLLPGSVDDGSGSIADPTTPRSETSAVSRHVHWGEDEHFPPVRDTVVAEVHIVAEEKRQYALVARTDRSNTVVPIFERVQRREAAMLEHYAEGGFPAPRPHYDSFDR